MQLHTWRSEYALLQLSSIFKRGLSSGSWLISKSVPSVLTNYNWFYILVVFSMSGCCYRIILFGVAWWHPSTRPAQWWEMLYFFLAKKYCTYIQNIVVLHFPWKNFAHQHSQHACICSIDSRSLQHKISLMEQFINIFRLLHCISNWYFMITCSI